MIARQKSPLGHLGGPTAPATVCMSVMGHVGTKARQNRQNDARLCSVPGCGKPYSAKGYCAMHRSRVRRHGTLDWQGHGRRWTEAEDQTLRRRYSSTENRVLARLLGRTVKSVNDRAQELWLSKQDDACWAAQEVADIFGVSRRTACTWAAKGWLPGAHKSGPKLWRVPDRALYAFMDADRFRRRKSVCPALMAESEWRAYAVRAARPALKAGEEAA